MLLVSVVLAVVFGVFVYTSYRSRVAETVQALNQALDFKFLQPHKFDLVKPDNLLFGQPPFDGETRVNRSFKAVPTFCATVDTSGVVTLDSTDDVEVTNELLNEAVKQAEKSGVKNGVLRELDLRFIARTTPDGVKYAFADISQEKSSLLKTVLTSIAIGAGALIAFFGISLYLSSIAVAPVEKAWKQQHRFVADASHELKTPLTVILANTDIMLNHGNPSDDGEKWLVNTKEEALRMKKLVDDMLFLAKSDNSKASYVKSVINLSDTVMNAYLPFEAVAFEQGIALDAEIDSGISMLADESAMRRLTAIFLDNACKYAGRGNSIKLTLCRKKEKIILSVSNTGSFIPKENADRLFERFYRADDARSQGGYGLGLSIAESIVREHKGKITVDSTEESGTTFSVAFTAK